jgi:hypothetical protein
VRLGWAIVLGIVAGAAVVWWLGRSDGRAPSPPASSAGPASDTGRGAGPALYRWRDDAGVVQLTDVPPTGRPFETIDVDALQRRNTFDPRTEAPAPAPE